MKILFIKNSQSKFISPDELEVIEWTTYEFNRDSFIYLSCGKSYIKNFPFDESRELLVISMDLRNDLNQFTRLEIDFERIKFVDLLTETKMLFLPLLESSNKPAKFDSSFITTSLNIGSEQYDCIDYLKVILSLHNARCTGLKLEEMILRAEFIKSSVLLEKKSNGFPVDCQFIDALSKHKIEFVRHLQNEVNNRYGQVYVDTDGIGQPMTLDYEKFAEYIRDRGYEWDRTEINGLFQLDQTYLKSKANIHSDLRLFYQTHKTVKACQFGALSELVENGYIKPQFELFNQKTGRTSPLPSRGFILNLPAWVRSSIKPKEGNVLIGMDWSQQEIAIAAALSNDSNYINLYNNKEGDVYLALAKMAKSAPESATKSSHSEIRQVFKAIQLGIGYGKGLKSLANDIYNVSRDSEGKPVMSKEQALSYSEEILNWHKSTFSDYWYWLAESANQARKYGYMKSLDGWIYLVPESVKPTQLMNFPMQANGAAILRRAIIRARFKPRLDVICTLHDAIYINARECEAELAITDLRECMDLACDDILRGKIKIRTEVSVYNSKDGYTCEKGFEILEMFKTFMKSKIH